LHSIGARAEEGGTVVRVWGVGVGRGEMLVYGEWYLNAVV